MFEPCYLKLLKNELDDRIKRLFEILSSCELCPRKCRVNRLLGEKGYCRSGKALIVSSYGSHFGEEPELTGTNGSGTIFLANCNLLCIYCQNYEISHLGFGKELSTEKVAQIMLYLQSMGCHNINLVTPTHFTPQLISAVSVAAKKGLKLPLVWNCSGYENVATIKLLDGIVDIYMPDIKYSKIESGEKYSNASDYFKQCKMAVKEMHRQVGDLKVDSNGIAESGLLIRHLVLPNDLAGSEKVLEFIVKEVSLDCYVNIMDQYRPCGKANEYPELNRGLTSSEYLKTVKFAKKLGLHRGFNASLVV